MTLDAGTTERISIDFAFTGLSCWGQEEVEKYYHLGVINFLFKDIHQEICIHIPKNISSTSCKKFSFLIQHQWKSHIFSKNLQVTIEQIKSLMIMTEIFAYTPTAFKESTQTISHKEHYERIDQIVELKIFEPLKASEKYTIALTVDKGLLSASLTNSQLVKDQNDLLELFTEILGSTILALREKFIQKIPSGTQITLNPPTISPCIHKEIGKIPQEDLKKMMEEIRILDNEFTFQSCKDPDEKRFFNRCFEKILKQIGRSALENILRKSLKVLIQGDISPCVDLIIDGNISKEFEKGLIKKCFRN